MYVKLKTILTLGNLKLNKKESLAGGTWASG